MAKETSQLTEKEALSIYARMMHSLDSSEFESFLSEDFTYSSQKVLTDMNSKDEFIEYIRPKLETIKKFNKRRCQQSIHKDTKKNSPRCFTRNLSTVIFSK